MTRRPRATSHSRLLRSANKLQHSFDIGRIVTDTARATVSRRKVWGPSPPLLNTLRIAESLEKTKDTGRARRFLAEFVHCA